MRKLCCYDNIYHRRKKVIANNHTIASYGVKRKKLVIKQNCKKYEQNTKYEKYQPQLINKLTKCAKMTEENGMIKNGSINGVGISKTDNYSRININFTTQSISSTNSSTTTSTANSNSNLVRNNNVEASLSPVSSINSNGETRRNVSPIVSGDGAILSLVNNKQSNRTGTVNPVGGRLQFFKDGKFIFELARTKEGERGGWVSVPRKTYWPPAAPPNNNNVTHNRNESSTSLSFSDDNSSIQSSPWQRDHCWKQATPRRDLSRELCMYYYRPQTVILGKKSILLSKLKRRRPYDSNTLTNRMEYAKYADSKESTNQLESLSENLVLDEKKEQNNLREAEMPIYGNKEESEADSVDDNLSSVNSATAKIEMSKEIHRLMAVDEDELTSDAKNEESKLNINSSSINKTRQRILLRPKLSYVLQKLIDKLPTQAMNSVPTQTGPGAGLFLPTNSSSRSSDLYYLQQHVSPRKRILREFEKVSLEESTISSMMKRSRSKSNASSDHGTLNSHPSKSMSASGAYAVGVTQHISENMSGTNMELYRSSNGSQSPFKSNNSGDNIAGLDKTQTVCKTSLSSTMQKHSQTSTSLQIQTHTVSRPISSYSITSLLGHSNISNSSDNNNQNNCNNGTSSLSTARLSISPKSPNPHQQNPSSLASRPSTSMSKKKSPINGNIGSPIGISNNSYSNHRSPMNSPVNYGRNTRSPDINSPSPDHHAARNHHHRHPFGSSMLNSTSISSPASGFHPYLPTCRGSPHSSGALSPTPLDRYRSYRATGSPSGISNGSINGPSYAYSSMNGSPTAYVARYSPSTYNTMQASPPHTSQLTYNHQSSSYNVNNLLPQPVDGNNGNVGRIISISNNYSPNSKARDVSPIRNTTNSNSSITVSTPSSRSHSTPSNCTPTRTIPKKTASIRHQYGSLSPNSLQYQHNTMHSDCLPKTEAGQIRKTMLDVSDVRATTSRPRSPPDQLQQRQNTDLDYQQSLLQHHPQSLSPSHVPPPLPHSYFGLYPQPPTNSNSASQSMAAAAAAYLHPLYYYNNVFRNPLWMHYPSAPLSPNSRAAANAGLLPYSPSLGSITTAGSATTLSPITSTRTSSSHAPIPIITSNNTSSNQTSQWTSSNSSTFQRQEEQSSDVPLNLSKH